MGTEAQTVSEAAEFRFLWRWGGEGGGEEQTSRGEASPLEDSVWTAELREKGSTIWDLGSWTLERGKKTWVPFQLG